MLDVIVGRDTLTGEVVIAQRRFGRPRAVVRIALAKVQAIRIYWQAVFSDNPDVGWWNAQLALLDGKVIPLGNIKGKPAAPPDGWLARFRRVSTLLDKPLEVLPSFADTQQTASTPVVDQLINNIRQQSGSPDKPPKENKYLLLELAMVWGCCFFVANTFTRMTTGNYWLHLLGESAMTFLFAMLCIAVPLVTLYELKSQRDRKLAHVVLYIVFCLICLTASAVFTVGLVQSLHDLYRGPIYDRGIIERTKTTCGKGCTFSIIVDGASYQVPDSRWFQTMEAGQEIEFLYGAMTHHAYPPPQSKSR